MQVTGTIRPTSGSKDFSREAWCRFIKSRPEFRQRPSREVPNPFKPGTMMATHLNEDAAEVVVEGQTAGRIHWSMSEEKLVVVAVDSSALPIVHQWAEALGGKFTEESW